MAQSDNMISKRVAISKANAQIVGTVAATAFVTIFCLVASHALWGQNAYQARVTTAKEAAHRQLVKNIGAYVNLSASYNKFISTPNNVIGGLTNGSGDNDGNNAKIILDALPSRYDFPALTSSIEKVLTDRGFKVSSITGTDDQLAQQSNLISSSPQPVPIPFSFSISNANYSSIGQLMAALQQSIRPIRIDTINLTGGSNNMTLTLSAHTFYQPGKSVNITKKEVK